MQIELTLNNNVLQVERSVYNFFTLLGDIGGFYGISVSFGAFFVSYMTYNNAENFLSRHLFKGAVSDDSSSSELDDER